MFNLFRRLQPYHKKILWYHKSQFDLTLYITPSTPGFQTERPRTTETGSETEAETETDTEPETETDVTYKYVAREKHGVTYKYVARETPIVQDWKRRYEQ